MLSHSAEHTVVIYKCVTTSCLFSQLFFFPSQKYTDKQPARNNHRTTYICKHLSSKGAQLGYIKTMKSLLKGFLMNVWISFSLALYFHSGEREEKCIIEDVPSDTLVTGRYPYDDVTYMQ